MRALVAKGWTPAAAAIAASDAQQKSSIRPDGPMGDPSTPGGSWGMFQWNRERLAALKRFGSKDWQSWDPQVEHFRLTAEKVIPG